MFAWLRNINTSDFVTPSLDSCLDSRCHFSNVVLIEPILRHENIELVEIRLFSELCQSIERDVAVDHVFHSCLGLAHIVNTAANDQPLFVSIAGLDRHQVTDTGLRNLESIALNQYLASRRWPCTSLVFEPGNVNIAVILYYKQYEVSPLYRSRLDLPIVRIRLDGLRQHYGVGRISK